ncbi:MAG: hypothetical protein MJ175_09155 [Clostridia bacterium]|nr:hypothetical protein [Clostridia bacterium]
MDNLIALFTDPHLASLNLIIFAFFIGACAAGFATVYHRRTIGELVRFLLENEAFSPETAKTLREAEQDLNIFVRLNIRRNPAFQRIVREVPPAEGEMKGKKDTRKLSDIPLYIDPKNKDRAAAMYSAKTASDANMWMVLLSIAVFAVVAYVSTMVIPGLVNMLNSLIESL